MKQKLVFGLVIILMIAIIGASWWKNRQGEPNVAVTISPTPSPSVLPTASPSTEVSTSYQAEDAKLVKAVFEKDNTGYTGTGYVNYDKTTGSYVEFTVDAPQAGKYHLAFRFANAGSTDRPMAIRVNDLVVVSRSSFPITGSWETWQTQTVDTTLKAGLNIVRATAMTTDGGPNLDKIDVTFVQNQVTSPSPRVSPVPTPTLSPSPQPTSTTPPKKGAGKGRGR